jgi:hypothetical protein
VNSHASGALRTVGATMPHIPDRVQLAVPTAPASSPRRHCRQPGHRVPSGLQSASHHHLNRCLSRRDRKMELAGSWL